MSINVKKYTKDQMAKMGEDAQAEVQELKRVNAALTEQISQMNGEAISRENVIAKQKADADCLRNNLDATEAALGRANAEVSRLTHELSAMKKAGIQYASAFKYAVEHPFENLWKWVERKMRWAE